MVEKGRYLVTSIFKVNLWESSHRLIAFNPFHVFLSTCSKNKTINNKNNSIPNREFTHKIESILHKTAPVEESSILP